MLAQALAHPSLQLDGHGVSPPGNDERLMQPGLCSSSAAPITAASRTSDGGEDGLSLDGAHRPAGGDDDVVGRPAWKK